METLRPFPGRLLESLLPLLSVAAAHMAVLAGGVVLPQKLGLLREMGQPGGGMPVQLLRWLEQAWPDPAAPFVTAALWVLAGYLLFYLAFRLLAGPFVASAVSSVVLLAGYPGWTDLMPTRGIFLLLPLGMASVGLGVILRRTWTWPRRTADRLASRRLWKAAWILLVVITAFLVAEHVRVGLRGPASGRFPYDAAGLPLGFSRQTEDLRKAVHLSQVVDILRLMAVGGLRADNKTFCLQGHCAATRYICRLGFSWGPLRPKPRLHFVTPVGWRIEQIPVEVTGPPTYWSRGGMTLGPTYNRGGLRYAQLKCVIGKGRSGDWFEIRQMVLSDKPHWALIYGSLFRRALEEYLWVEVECDDPNGVEIELKLNKKDLPVALQVLPAGDRYLVRGSSHLTWPQHQSGLPLTVRVTAPAGMLDLDLFIQAAKPAELVEK